MTISTIILGTCMGLASSIQVPLSIYEDEPLNRNSRIDTGVEVLQTDSAAHQLGLPQGYTGRGVLVGIYDTGIDYNHINFHHPETGETRISMAILYRELEGAADSIREVYLDPMQIDTLTTDTHATWHGTHTAGTAAGSYRGWGLQGMAPEASLALCGSSKLERDRMEDALRSIFARADELQMPCVVNVSIGNAIGWKDGKSPIPLLCEELTDGGEAPGRVIVFAAGNDGAKEFSLDHTFVETDQPVYTMLQAPKNGKGEAEYRNFGIEAYSSDGLPMDLSLVAYDTLRHEEVDFALQNLRGEQFSPVMLQDTAYYTDSIAPEHDDRRYLCWEMEDTCTLQTADPIHTVLAARFRGQKGSSFTAYYVMNGSIGTYRLSDAGQPGWLHSTAGNSISDFCCTESVISVGAYNGGVDSLVNILGNTIYPIEANGRVASFSSYGTTGYGVDKPDVVAPGVSVISSFSTFCDASLDYYTSGRNPKSPIVYQLPPAYADDRWNYWSADVGTSQAAPVVAGIIALWLEADPELTTNQIREILRTTSRFDESCLSPDIDSRQAGFGKVDAVAGMEAVLALAGIEIVNADSSESEGKSVIYDLYGRKIPAPTARGLYIIDGKRVILPDH